MHAQADELRAQSEELAQQNEELSQQADEQARQSDELSRQGEELASQNEELQAQAEEIGALNVALERRERLLETLLDTARASGTEQSALDHLAAAATELFDDPDAVAVIYDTSSGVPQAVAWADRDGAGAATDPPPGLAVVVAAEQRTAALDDADQRPDLALPVRPGPRLRAALCAPRARRRRAVVASSPSTSASRALVGRGVPADRMARRPVRTRPRDAARASRTCARPSSARATSSPRSRTSCAIRWRRCATRWRCSTAAAP